jgi:pimeloyl-ACP methyl ester carboxylesterase
MASESLGNAIAISREEVRVTKKAWSRLIVGALAPIVLGCLGVGVLVLWPAPAFDAPGPPPADRQQPTDVRFVPPDIRQFRMRDGEYLSGRQFVGDGAKTVVLLHGVMSEAARMDSLSARLRERAAATVIALDLRGHGSSGGRPGDVDYIGQYEDDVADVIDAVRREQPRRAIILGGHSMGGGIALRYADRRRLPLVDGYLLFAPLMGLDSPTSRSGPSPGEAGERTSAMRVHVPRTIGLALLDAIGITWGNGLNTLFFNVPATSRLRSYSFRAMVGMTPPDHRAALAADERPLLTLVGDHDQAFHVDRFPDVIALHQGGRVEILKGLDHFGLPESEAAATTAAQWIASSVCVWSVRE